LKTPIAFHDKNGKPLYGDGVIYGLNQGIITLTPEQFNYVVALYDDSIRFIDNAIGDFFVKLKSLGLYERALIIVTSDHGESFNEHGEYGHRNVYNECSNVALLIKFPYEEFGGRRVNDLIELTDIYPTVLETLRLPFNESIDGKSILPLLKGNDAPNKYAYSQRYSLQSVRNAQWKIIRDTYNNSFELFNLITDPQEKENCSDVYIEEFQELKKSVAEFFQINPEGWHFNFWTPNSTKDPQITLSLNTDDKFENCSFLGENGNMDKENIVWDAHNVKTFFSRSKQEELVAKTASSNGRIALSIKSNSAFSVVEPDGTIIKGTSYFSILDPAENRYPDVVVQPDIAQEQSVFSFFYVKPAVSRKAAKDLSEEESAGLKALGYLE